MPFDLENLNAGTWFPYPLPKDNPPATDPEAPEERVCFRMADVNFLRTLDKETTEIKREFVQPRKESGRIDKRAALQHVEYQVIKDQDARSERLWDYTIVDWNLFDKYGNVIPCTRENKITLMNKSITFAKYSADCLEILQERSEKDKEDERKN